MDDEMILNLSRVVDSVRETMSDPVWLPLEALLPSEEVAGFMFMGTADAREYLYGRRYDGSPRISTTQKRIYLYKHGITRHYLNIGEDLECYLYVPAMCEIGDPVYRQVDREWAIGLAFAGLKDLGATRSTAYDDEYKASRNQRLRAAGWNIVSS